MIINNESVIRLEKLRKTLASEINKRVAAGIEHKSYEGTLEVLFVFPDAFDDPDGTKNCERCLITLHCYIIGTLGRHYRWAAFSFEDALEQCEADIYNWIKEDRYDT